MFLVVSLPLFLIVNYFVNVDLLRVKQHIFFQLIHLDLVAPRTLVYKNLFDTTNTRYISQLFGINSSEDFLKSNGEIGTSER